MIKKFKVTMSFIIVLVSFFIQIPFNQLIEARGISENMENNKSYFLVDDFENEKEWNAKGARYNSVSVDKVSDIVRFGEKSLKLEYDFLGTEGVSGIYAEPSEKIELPGKPNKIGMWVYGDGAGHWLRFQLKDSEGQNFNVDLTEEEPNGVNWLGWKYVEGEISDSWKAPFTIETNGVRYMATKDSMKNSGTIYIDRILALYDDLNEDTVNPNIFIENPRKNDVLTDNKPFFEILVEDEESGIDFKRTILKIDGVEVEAEDKGKKITYQVEKKLSDGLHEAYIEVFDHAGNHHFETWNFMVDSGNFFLEWAEGAKSVAGSKSQIDLNLNNLKNIENISFDISTSEIVKNLSFEVSKELIDNYQNIDGKYIFNDLEKIDLKNSNLGIFSYDLNSDAEDELTIKLTNGEYSTSENKESKKFFVKDFTSEIIQPLSLSIEGISVGTESKLTVKDLDGNLINDATISILNDHKLIEFKENNEIFKSDKGSVSGTTFKKVNKGERYVVAKNPKVDFPYYRIYIENGEQRYYHVKKEAVKEVDWNSLINEYTTEGVIKTNNLTLSQIPLKLQAKKGNLVSQILVVNFSQQLGSNSPENILMTWADNIEDSLHISWKTNTKEKKTIVQTRTTSNNKWKETEGESNLLGDSSGEKRIHHVDLKNLKENTKYQIRLGDGDNWSEILDYKTPNIQKKDFTFTFVADSQAVDKEGFQLYKNIVDLAKIKDKNTEFVFHGGDIVEEGNYLEQWDNFLEVQSETNLPLVSVMGNHDVYGDGTNTYNTLIKNPSNGYESMKNTTYYIDYGHARFIVLNSEVGRKGMNDQLDWLKETIKSNDKQWTIVSFHRAPYKSNPKRPDDVTMEVFAPVLEEMAVDLVLVGHDHSYMRTFPMKNSLKSEKGTTYITGGSAGPKFYPSEYPTYSAKAYSEEKQVATNFRVSESKIYLEAFNSDGDTIDTFTFEKEVKGQIEKSGWIKKDSNWHYYIEDSMKTGWVKDNGKWYYLSDEGIMQSGWTKVDKHWYFLNKSGAMQTGWTKVDGKWYYLNKSGVMQKAWQKVNGRWYYMNPSGAMQTGWNKVSGKWYYMADSGAMQTGWTVVDGKKYFMNSSGAMQTGWVKSKASWYYMADSGAMQTDWQKINGIWYYLNANGRMRTGWTKVDNNWYYLHASGAMQTGWLKLNSHWYFLNSDGSMQTGSKVIYGKEYHFHSSGRMI